MKVLVLFHPIRVLRNGTVLARGDGAITATFEETPDNLNGRIDAFVQRHTVKDKFRIKCDTLIPVQIIRLD